MIPIKRKTELALCNFLSSFPTLKDATILAGHRENKRELPCIIVFAESSSNNDLDISVFNVQIKIFILTQIDDEDIETHDRRINAVTKALSDPNILRLALNRPFSGPDQRIIKQFHLYDLIETQAEEGRDERHFGEVLNYVAICQGVDDCIDKNIVRYGSN